MKMPILIITYCISFIPLITNSFFDTYYLMVLMLLIVFAGYFKKDESKTIQLGLILGSTSVMLYSLMMGKSDSIFIEWVIFTFIIYLFGKIAKEMKKEKEKIIKNKIEKYFVSIISQLAVFLIIMMVLQEMTAISYYIMISFVIVYVFSKKIESLTEVIYFVVTQSIAVCIVLNFVSEVTMIEKTIYILIIMNTAIVGFYNNQKINLNGLLKKKNNKIS